GRLPMPRRAPLHGTSLAASLAVVLLVLASPALAQPGVTPPAPPAPPKHDEPAPRQSSPIKPSKPLADVALTAEHLRALTWRPIGPANMGGRVSDIALVPGRPHTVFVGTA